MTASPLLLNGKRGSSGLRRWFAVFAVLTALVAIPAHAAERIRGEIAVATDEGYARLAFRFAEEVGASVRVNGAIMVITFNKPVDVSVDRLSSGAPGYISAARRDPDGTAIRVALVRRIKVNTIAAAERFYLDLMPENWTGMLPGLPQSVIADLASRAVEAGRMQQRAAVRAEPPALRVKVAAQPTFVRYGFEIPDGTNVRTDRSEGALTLKFDRSIKWDLADVKSALPSTLEAVDADAEFDQVAVKFTFNGTPSVKTFREDKTIYVDIGRDIAKPMAEESPAKPELPAAIAAPAIEPPETIPVKETADAPPKAAPPVKSAEGAPPKLEAAPLPADAPSSATYTPMAAAPAPAKAAPMNAAAPPATEPAATPDAMAKPAAAVKAELKPAASKAAPGGDPNAPVKAVLNYAGENLRLEFPFAGATPAAVFRRAEFLWLVFDSGAQIDVDALKADSTRIIRDATFERGEDGVAIVKVRLLRPRLASLEADGTGWIVSLGDTVSAPTQALNMTRSLAGKGSAIITIPFADASKVHVVGDPKMGDRLVVITAPAPVRGFVKSQNFVELNALASTHGIVVAPIADDLAATISPSQITIGRPGGLALSSAPVGEQASAAEFKPATFDTQVWGFDRQAKFAERQAELLNLAADAPPAKKKQARFNLARFYLARDMAAEAKAVLDVALGDNPGADEVTGLVLRAIAEVMLDRPELAIKELSAAAVGNQQDAPAWRAVALAREGKWPEAHARFKSLDNAMAGMPLELQRMVMENALRTSIEVQDFNGANRTIGDFDNVGIPPELAPSIQVLTGRLLEGMNRPEEALKNYREAAASADRRAAAQAKLRETVLLFNRGGLKRPDAVHELETLTTVWRGDETESEGLKLLAHLYTEDGRYGEAFHVMRTAMRAHPNSDMTRKIQDEAAVTFDSLFLAGKGDALSPIEALGLFYDYRELTPIGRRGDEMIRKLADRLVGVDLLTQAAELLQHQVDNRLQGAARAQIATRLATIYLMNRKPDRALAALRSSRNADISNEIREHRLLLEARALSDGGRYDLALELIANVNGPLAIRLRTDIYWTAKRWRESAEQMELLYGERWKEFSPLSDTERTDILRAAIAYSLADEPIGLSRLREKYAAKMADGPDRRAFDVVSAPIGAANPEFQDVAKRVSNTGALDAFLRDLNARYQGQPGPLSAKEPLPAKADPAPTGSLPRLPRPNGR